MMTVKEVEKDFTHATGPDNLGAAPPSLTVLSFSPN